MIKKQKRENLRDNRINNLNEDICSIIDNCFLKKNSIDYIIKLIFHNHYFPVYYFICINIPLVYNPEKTYVSVLSPYEI